MGTRRATEEIERFSVSRSRVFASWLLRRKRHCGPYRKYGSGVGARTTQLAPSVWRQRIRPPPAPPLGMLRVLRRGGLSEAEEVLPTTAGRPTEVLTCEERGRSEPPGPSPHAGEAGQGVSSQTSSRKNRRSSAQPPDGARASSPMGTNATR